MIATEDLADAFATIADTLVDDFDIIEFLELVTVKAAAISQASAAGSVLADPTGHLQFLAASEESVRLLEVLVVQTREGPCEDCFRTGEPVVNTDLRLEEAQRRWPVYADLASSMGYRSVHVLPLRHRGESIGALNLFSTHADPFEPGEVRIMQAFADIATVRILQERTIRASGVLTKQLQTAVVSRVSIEQAKGFLACTHAISVDDAFVMLRSHVRAARLKLGTVAADIVTNPQRHPDLTTPGPDMKGPRASGQCLFPARRATISG